VAARFFYGGRQVEYKKNDAGPGGRRRGCRPLFSEERVRLHLDPTPRDGMVMMEVMVDAQLEHCVTCTPPRPDLSTRSVPM